MTTTTDDAPARTAGQDDALSAPPKVASDHQSLLDSIAEGIERKANPNRRLRMPVPGAERVLLRFQRVDAVRLEELAQEAAKAGDSASEQAEAKLNTYLDCLIAGLDSVHVRTPNGDVVPINPASEHPTKFDATLKRLLRLQCEDRSRDVAFALFDRSELAVRTAYTRLSLWMSNALTDSDEEIVGES